MNEQIPQTLTPKEPEQPKKLGKNFIFLITILVIVLAGAGLLLASQRVSKEIKEQKVEVAVPDKYAGWETYSNEEYGYEIKYPVDFDIKQNEDSVWLIVPVEKYFGTQLANEARIELRKPKVSCEAVSNLGYSRSADQGFIKAGGVEFTKQTWGDNAAGQLYTGIIYRNTGNDFCYEIVLFTRSANGAGFFIVDQSEIKRIDTLHAKDMENIANIADKIVSTLKFINKTVVDISDWQIYRNEEFGFEFEYPGDWEQKETREGCGPVFAPSNIDLSKTPGHWLTICGPYVNSSNTIEDFAFGTISSGGEISEKEVLVDGHRAIKQIVSIDENVSEINAFVASNSEQPLVTGIYLSNRTDQPISQFEDVFDQILSTFKFIEPELVSGSDIVSWDASNIAVSGRIILSINDFPDSVQVSPEAYFGSSDRFKDVKISPDDKWLAVSIGGAAHDFGWLYEISTKKLVPVAFQYGGGVDVKGWINDKEVVFEITSPKPETREKVVNVNDLPEYPGGL